MRSSIVTMRHNAFVLAVVFVPCVAAGQTLPGGGAKAIQVTEAFAAMKAEAWTTAVQAHTAGTIDQPLRTIASWPREHVTAVLGRVIGRLHRLLAVPGVPAAQELAELTDTLVLALSLHTDLAIAEREAFVQPSSTSGAAAVILVDGHETRRIQRSYHWVFARRIAGALAALPAESPRILAWYRAISAGLQEWGDYDVAAVHLDAGLRLFAQDAMLALYQGTLHQALGDARLQQYVRRRSGDDIPTLRRPQVPDRLVERPPASDLRRVPKASQTELEAAEREFRLALSIDPTLHEARIRLAHVLSTLGDDRGTAETVRPALETPLSPFLEFYAALVLGRSEEHLGRYAEADEAYARAAARFPDAPSARIGRSRVALAQGHAAQALASIAGVTTRGGAQPADPWLHYLRQHDVDGKSLLSAWRKNLE
jgi:tetratricopeptide (TPR) repeat protein